MIKPIVYDHDAAALGSLHLTPFFLSLMCSSTSMFFALMTISRVFNNVHVPVLILISLVITFISLFFIYHAVSPIMYELLKFKGGMLEGVSTGQFRWLSNPDGGS